MEDKRSEPPTWTPPLVHPDLLFFEWMIYEEEFMGDAEVPEDLQAALDDVAAPGRAWDSIQYAGIDVQKARRALEAAPDQWDQPARLQSVAAMLGFSDACEVHGVRSSLRPILWKHFWENGERPLISCVPKHFHRSLQGVFGYPFTTFSWTRHLIPYALLWFDPRTTSRTEWENLRAFLKGSFPRAPDRGKYPLREETIRTYVHMLSAVVHAGEFRGIRGTSEPYTAKELAALQEAWDRFVAGTADKPPDELVDVIIEQFEHDQPGFEPGTPKRAAKIDPTTVVNTLNEMLKESEDPPHPEWAWRWRPR